VSNSTSPFIFSRFLSLTRIYTEHTHTERQRERALSSQIEARMSSEQQAKLIDGKAIAQTIRSEIADEVRLLSQKYGKVRFFLYSYSNLPISKLRNLEIATSFQNWIWIWSSKFTFTVQIELSCTRVHVGLDLAPQLHPKKMSVLDKRLI